jgi:hypothetical protein
MLTEVTLGGLEYIASHLRDEDWVEIRNVLDHDSPLLFAHQAYQLVSMRGRGRIAWHDGKPAACVAFIEHRTGVWDIQLYGTKDLRATMKPVLRWIRDTLPEIRDRFGGVRLQADSHHDHAEAHKFLRGLGAEVEATMRRFGKDGSTYIRFVWISEETAAPLLAVKAA